MIDIRARGLPTVIVLIEDALCNLARPLQSPRTTLASRTNQDKNFVRKTRANPDWRLILT